MAQHRIRDLPGQGFNQSDVAATGYNPDRVDDEVIREDIAHIVGAHARVGDVDVDVEADILRLGPLEFIRADRARHDEIVNEDAVGLDVLVKRNIAASEKTPVDPGLPAGGLRIGDMRNEIADHGDGREVDSRCAIAAAETAAKTEIIRPQRQETRDVRRLQRSSQSRQQTRLPAQADEGVERRYVHVIEETAPSLDESVEHRPLEAAF